MKVYTDIDQFDPIKKAFVTTGTFDGVHLGHRVILKKIIEEAKKEKYQTMLVCIDSSNQKIVEFLAKQFLK